MLLEQFVTTGFSILPPSHPPTDFKGILQGKEGNISHSEKGAHNRHKHHLVHRFVSQVILPCYWDKLSLSNLQKSQQEIFQKSSKSQSMLEFSRRENADLSLGEAMQLPCLGKQKLPKDLAITKPRHLGVFKGLATLWLILLFNLCLLCSNENFFPFSLSNLQVSKFLLLQRKDGKQCTAVTNAKLGWTRDCIMQKDLPHCLDDPNFTSSSPKPVLNYLN